MKHNDKKSTWQRVGIALLLVLLSGCAGQQLHREGLSLMKQGRTEEGLSKLAAAVKAAPDDVPYRTDYLRNLEISVNKLLSAANSERGNGNLDNARALYQRVLVLQPDNSRAQLGLAALAMDQRHAAALIETEKWLKQNRIEAARTALKPVLLENPKNGQALTLQRQIEARLVQEKMAEPTLKAQFTKPISLQFRDANLKMVFEALARTSGINVLLDRDVRPDLKTSIFVKDVSVEDTIDLILLQNQLEKKIISDNTVFIYPSTPAKLKDYQDLKIRSFHLTNADPKNILTMLKTLLKTKDIFIHEKTNSIVMRDTPDAIRLAEKLVADQDIAEPEVMLEVEVLEVTTTRLSELGIKYPNSFSIATPDTVKTFSQLRNLAAGALLVSPLSATLNLKLEDGDTNVLASPRIRVRNREKAKIMIGSRVPVITNSVTPLVTGGAVTTGSVQYLDIGLKLEVEPDIHLDNEVVIKVSLDVSSIIREVQNAQSGTLAYEVGTRNAATVLRLKDGETQILAGLINDEDRKTASKIPGLGQIPMLGRLFSSHKDDGKKTEIVLSITPHMVGSAHLPDADEMEYWAGTESSVRSGLVGGKPLGSVTLGTAAAPASPALQPRTMLPAINRPAPLMAINAAPMTLSWQGPTQAKVGDIINVTLNAQTAQALNGLDLQLRYDPAVFKALDVTEGSFLKQKNSQSGFDKTVDATSGQVQLNLSGAEGVSGSGSIATLVLQVLAARSPAQISLAQATPTGSGGEAQAVGALPPFNLTVLP